MARAARGPPIHTHACEDAAGAGARPRRYRSDGLRSRATSIRVGARRLDAEAYGRGVDDVHTRAVEHVDAERVLARDAARGAALARERLRERAVGPAHRPRALGRAAVAAVARVVTAAAAH